MGRAGRRSRSSHSGTAKVSWQLVLAAIVAAVALYMAYTEFTKSDSIGDDDDDDRLEGDVLGSRDASVLNQGFSQPQARPNHGGQASQPAMTADCDHQDQVRQLLQNGRWQEAANILQRCVDAEPRARPGAHYALGKTYYEMENWQKAKEQLIIANELVPNNPDYHASAGDACMKASDPAGGKTQYSRALELSLGIKDWTEILDYVRPGGLPIPKYKRKLKKLKQYESLLLNLLDAYLWQPGTLFAARLFDVACALDPENSKLHDEAAVVQVGTGMLDSGLRHIINATFLEAAPSIKSRYSQKEIDFRRRSILFATQLQSHVTQLARTMLLSQDADDLWTVVRKRCGFNATRDFVGRKVYKREELKELYLACFDKQNIIGELWTNIYLDGYNLHEYRPIHHAVGADHHDLVKHLISHEVDLTVTNKYGQAAMHIAMSHGAQRVLPLLVKAGLKVDEPKDLDGRTPLDILCRHPWFIPVLKPSLPKGTKLPCDDSVPRKEVRTLKEQNDDEAVNKKTGGWLPGVGTAAEEADIHHCDIDVREGLTAEEFKNEYLALTRPVLVKGGFPTSEFPLTYDEVAEMYESTVIQPGTIPYASQFGFEGVNDTVSDYLDYLRGAGQTDFSPRYIFEARVEDFHTDFAHVPMTTPEVTGLSCKQRQFYLGPALSGAPAHFHGHAWNGMAYGRKRWFLWSPAHSYYSKKPIREWLKEDYPTLDGAAKPLECVQEAGDVIYVPNNWGHGVLNLQESIGWACEFDWDDIQFSV